MKMTGQAFWSAQEAKSVNFVLQPLTNCIGGDILI